MKENKKIPSGIRTFDQIIRGGSPSGSMILLMGESGSGYVEFAYTSIAALSLMKNDPMVYNSALGEIENLVSDKDKLKIPENICYISFAHGIEDIKREMEYAFPHNFSNIWDKKNFIFKDFSSVKKKEILDELISTLEVHAPDSLVILDSLPALLRAYQFNWIEIISFLEYIQKRSKEWDGLVYLLAGSGIIGERREEEIMDIADGVLVFEWVQEGFLRQQSMYIQKFRGILPQIARDRIVRFDTLVTNTEGFMVTNVKRISGRK